jgi:hypothetical protein
VSLVQAGLAASVGWPQVMPATGVPDRARVDMVARVAPQGGAGVRALGLAGLDSWEGGEEPLAVFVAVPEAPADGNL